MYQIKQLERLTLYMVLGLILIIPSVLYTVFSRPTFNSNPIILNLKN